MTPEAFESLQKQTTVTLNTKTTSNKELLKEYLKEVDTLSKALDGNSKQWDLEDHKASLDKLCDIAEEIIAEEITDWSATQMLR